VRDADSPDVHLAAFRHKLPILGVCYGAQLLAHSSGGEVRASAIREYGRAKLGTVNTDSPLMRGLDQHSQVWMSHADTITSVPDNFRIIASTDTVRVAAFEVTGEPTYGIQFHPEVTHSLQGKQLLHNFVVDICGCSQNWTADSFVETTIADRKQKLGSDRVVMALSGRRLPDSVAMRP